MAQPPFNEPSGAAVAQRLTPSVRVLMATLALATAGATVLFRTQADASAPTGVTPSAAAARFPRSAEAAPVFIREWVTPPGHTISAHSSSICALPSGDLLAIWYGGSREGAADVALYTARLPAAGGPWSRPVLTMDRAIAQRELERVIKKVGNAVVFPDQAGRLWLVYVSVSLGGWSGSTLNVKCSGDEGRTWGDSERLTLNPFFNLSSLVRNKPIYADDGRIGLPVYHEMAAKFPQMLWFTPGADGRLEDYQIRNLASEPGLIQPTLVPLGQNRVLMLLRDRGTKRTVHSAYSDDSGWTWSNALPIGLPNPDAAVDALRLRDGRILIVYNHAGRGRENLGLALSGDQGRTWRRRAIFEDEPREEFSYPNLAEDDRGRIHLTYTWRRERIRHVSFNLAWLDGRQLAQDSARP